MAGTTPLQLLVKEKRSKSIPVGRFKEQDFSYLGDTVVLWDLNQYFANPIWREDAIRKSKKRRMRQLNHDFLLIGTTTTGGTTTSTRMTTTTTTSHTTTTTTTTKSPSTKKTRRQRCHDIMEALYQKSLLS